MVDHYPCQRYAHQRMLLRLDHSRPRLCARGDRDLFPSAQYLPRTSIYSRIVAREASSLAAPCMRPRPGRAPASADGNGAQRCASESGNGHYGNFDVVSQGDLILRRHLAARAAVEGPRGRRGNLGPVPLRGRVRSYRFRTSCPAATTTIARTNTCSPLTDGVPEHISLLFRLSVSCNGRAARLAGRGATISEGLFPLRSRRRRRRRASR